jgi:hypothetical protein
LSAGARDPVSVAKLQEPTGLRIVGELGEIEEDDKHVQPGNGAVLARTVNQPRRPGHDHYVARANLAEHPTVDVKLDAAVTNE